MSENRLRECDAVHGYVGRVCFKKGPPHHVGAELEWLVAPTTERHRPVPLAHLLDLLRDADPMPGGSLVTLEPGGQVELSSAVADTLSGCWQSLRLDVDRLDHLLTRRDLAVLPTALEPSRPPLRLLRTPRYDAMQVYFDRYGEVGRLMMTSTAAVQVNLDAGADAAEVAARWSVLHAVGPALVAAFANSPVHQGRRTGWKSTRQHVWQQLEPSRAAVPAGSDPVAGWAEYALDAPVMMRRGPGPWLAAPGFTFREWVLGAAGDRPTEDDLAYHLTTLFPPVRPRGWFEVRYLDAQPPGLWPVPVAVLTALLNDPAARDLAVDATQPVRHRWRDAALLGLTDPELVRAAARCFDIAIAALPRLGAEPELVRLVERFVESYVARGRSPADDLVDAADGQDHGQALAGQERG